MPDIIFLAKNRLEFTRASFETLIKNTNWSLVRCLHIFDDRSKDGTEKYLMNRFWEISIPFQMSDKARISFHNVKEYNSPAAVTLDYVRNHEPDSWFIKIDNDVIVPKFWLEKIVPIMEVHPELDLLGIEPAKSRVPHFESGARSPQPEYDPKYAGQCYAPCNSIGGIGAMRMSVFQKYGNDLIPHSVYGGFTEWQIKHTDIIKGWINPPLDLFLLDRLPIEPWVSYSKKYIGEKNQRSWQMYPKSDPFWDWWKNPCADF
jgi:hypothetical protein